MGKFPNISLKHLQQLISLNISFSYRIELGEIEKKDESDLEKKVDVAEEKKEDAEEKKEGDDADVPKDEQPSV